MGNLTGPNRQGITGIQRMLSKKKLVLPKDEPPIPSGHSCEHSSNTKWKLFVFIYFKQCSNNNQRKRSHDFERDQGSYIRGVGGRKGKRKNEVIVKTSKLRD